MWREIIREQVRRSKKSILQKENIGEREGKINQVTN
jgi:hypothetical protein